MKLVIRLIVGTILVFATVAVFYKPACSCTSHRAAFRSMMKSDLRNLTAAQIEYRKGHNRYAPTLPLLDFKTKTGSHIWIIGANADGFLAEARHDSAPDARCVVALKPFLNDSVSREGEPKCFW